MSVRDPGFDPRRSRPGPMARRIRATAGRAGGLLPLAIVALAAVTAIGFGGGILGVSAPSPSPAASSGTAGLAGGSAGPGASGSGTPTASTPDLPSASPSGSPAASPTAGPAFADIVPVTSFRSGRASVRAADVRAIADGGKGTYKGLVLVERDADGILEALGYDRAAFGARLRTVDTAAGLATRLAAHRSELGFLRAGEVRPSVRALGWGSKSLFGVGRVTDRSDWPLGALLPVGSDDAPAYDPGTAWTIVAGGDILLDRGVSLAIGASRAGTDFPFNGGTAEITGTCKDCSPLGWDTPYTRRTGNAGAVRRLISGADIAIANFENPAPNAWRFHAHGTVFSANPKTIAGLKAVGIDWVSMANNHIGDAGRTGVLQTMANLDRYGIAHSGAGKNAANAHKAALIRVGSVTVGILGYDTIAPGYNAGSTTPGSARMTAAWLKKDVAAARKAGADVVIVFPHWGVEYRAAPTAVQRGLAHAAIDAGADMVIGNHPHWVEGMEVYKGRPIWYALGNLVFDQTWSIPTMEGITLEMTFQGKELVQVRMRPHLILGRAQPNFLDPLGDGAAVMSQLFGASRGLLGW